MQEFQFMDGGLNRRWISRDGSRNYRCSIEEITVPTRVIAGSIDKLCPHNRRTGFEELGSERKNLVVTAEDEGFSTEYSHLNFVHGKKAPAEIHPPFNQSIEKFESSR